MRELTDKEKDLLDQMFDIRRANNLNWRLALENLIRFAPPEISHAIFDQINTNDLEINRVFGELRKAMRD